MKGTNVEEWLYVPLQGYDFQMIIFRQKDVYLGLIKSKHGLDSSVFLNDINLRHYIHKNSLKKVSKVDDDLQRYAIDYIFNR